MAEITAKPTASTGVNSSAGALTPGTTNPQFNFGKPVPEVGTTNERGQVWDGRQWISQDFAGEQGIDTNKLVQNTETGEITDTANIVVSGTLDESKLSPGVRAGKSADPELAKMVESGASLAEIYEKARSSSGSYAAGIVDMLAPRMEVASQMSGKRQFNAYKTLGLIPRDAEYVEAEDGSWGYTRPSGETEYRLPSGVEPELKITSKQMSYLRKYHPDVYQAVQGIGLTDAYKKYGNVLSMLAFETEINANNPELFKIYQEGGTAAYNKAVSEADKVLSLYGGDPLKAIEGGDIGAVRLLYGSKQTVDMQKYVASSRLRANAQSKLSQYINKETGAIDDLTPVIMAGIDAATLRSAGFDITNERYAELRKSLNVMPKTTQVSPETNPYFGRTLRQLQSDFVKSESAFSAAMDRIDKANPGMSTADKVALYENTPEYKDYLMVSSELSRKTDEEDPVKRLEAILATVPNKIMENGRKQYAPLRSIATDDTQRAAFGAIDDAMMAVRGGAYTAASAITSLPLFFLGLAVDPVGTVVGTATGIGTSAVGMYSIISSRAKSNPERLTPEQFYDLGSDAMSLIIAGMMLKSAYDMTPRAARVPFENAVRTLITDERGYIRLPGTSRSVVDQIRVRTGISEGLANELVRSLDRVTEAIADKNQIALYDSAKVLMRSAKEAGDPTLINYANDIMNNPRSYIEGIDGISKSMSPEDILTKLEDTAKSASKSNQSLKTLTARDVGLSDAEFAEFIKERVYNPDITVEEFKASLKPKPDVDWDTAVRKMTEDYNRKIAAKEAADKAIRAKEAEEIQTTMSRIKEGIDKRIAKDKADRLKRESELAQVQKRLIERAKSGYDSDYARKVGEINKEIREHLKQIKDKAKQTEEQIAKTEEQIKTASKTGNKEKVEAATKLKEELERELKELTKEKTDTETELEEATKLAEKVATETATDNAVAPEIVDGLKEEVKENTKELSSSPLNPKKEEEETALSSLTEPEESTEEEVEQTVEEDVENDTPVTPVETVETEETPEPTKLPETPSEPDKPDTKKPNKSGESALEIGMSGMATGKADKPSLPPGSVYWRQGWDGKYIPPPYNQPKPLSLGRRIPAGAKNTNSNKPSETIQVIGIAKGVPGRVSVDLGWTDILIVNGTSIDFTGGGLSTDVGKGIGNNTQGMSVGATETESEPLPTEELDFHYEALDELGPAGAFADEDDNWLSSTKRSMNRTKHSKKLPRRRGGDNETTMGGVRL